MIDHYDHMNHMEYIKLFESEQRVFLEEISAEFRLLEDDDLKIVQRHFSIDYLHPLFAGNNIEVNTKVADIGESSFVFEQEIRVRDRISAKSKTVYVMSDGKGAKKAIPLWYRDNLVTKCKS